MTPWVYGLDPGNERSALVVLNERGKVASWALLDNKAMRLRLMELHPPTAVLVIEKVVSYGMPVGEEVFETVYWSGRFCESWSIRWGTGEGVERLPRLAVKEHLCHDSRAKDSNIRAALIDRFGPGKEKAIGLKKTPGPLYGFKKDLWSALAVAVTWRDINA
jgi:hypothetical protein